MTIQSSQYQINHRKHYITLSQTHQSVLEILTNTGTHRALVDHIIHDLFRATATHPPRRKQHAYSVANVFSGSAAA